MDLSQQHFALSVTYGENVYVEGFCRYSSDSSVRYPHCFINRRDAQIEIHAKEKTAKKSDHLVLWRRSFEHGEANPEGARPAGGRIFHLKLGRRPKRRGSRSPRRQGFCTKANPTLSREERI